jgi:hypothetical protein
MYAIFKLIYGFPLNLNFDNYYENLEDNLQNDKQVDRTLEKMFENSLPGFLSYYSLNAENTPRAFGIKIDSFDEGDIVKVSDINLVPSEEVKQQYQELFNNLNPMIQSELTNLSEFKEPTVFFLWSSY